MPHTISAEFETRRDAEMSVEHLVKEYGIDRSVISIVSVAEENSAGTKASGSDLDQGRSKGASATQPALSGKLQVSVQADDDQKAKILTAFETYGGKPS